MRILPGDRIRLAAWLVLGFSITACGGADDQAPGASSSSGSGGSGGAGGGDACTELPPAPPIGWCARVLPGHNGTRPPMVDLSAAHAAARFFSPVAAYSTADQALIAALDGPAADVAPDLNGYATALAPVACSEDASSTSELPAATLELVDDVAIIHPGKGEIVLPAGANAVMIDLRGIPDAAGLSEALEAAVSPAITAPIDRAKRKVRKHSGLTDEVFTEQNVYKNSVRSVALPPIPATGARDLPLAILTDATLAPEAAELAGTLKLAGRAWLFGEDIRAEVAEARWFPVGERGMAVRVFALQAGDASWPDVIHADRRMGHPECAASELVGLGAPPAATLGAADRPGYEVVQPFDDVQPTSTTLATSRAALVVAHAAARTFYPYFATVGDIIDDRLLETLASLDPVPDEAELDNALRRFGNALTDGHNFVFPSVSTDVGCMPVFIEDIDGEPVVRRSMAAGIDAGDTITSIAGVAASDWYATELARAAGATDGYRFNVATRRYLSLAGPTDFGLRAADGSTRTVTFEPQPFDDCRALGYAPSMRPAGLLTDLGAPDLYYINLDGKVLSDIADFRASLAEAAPAAGLVLDMRGYPGIDAYETAQRLIQQDFSSPIFRTPVLTGVDDRSTLEESYPFSPIADGPSYAGPIVLLVGHGTVSAAENFSTMLVDANRVKVIGRRSAGTNGNITGVQTPGGFGFSFTGMEVLHADAEHTTFHGIGIAPDADVPMTAGDFEAGVDPELQAAIDWLASH